MIYPDFTPYNRLIAIDKEARIKSYKLKILLYQLNSVQDPLLVKNLQRDIDDLSHDLKTLNYQLRMECLTEDSLKELLAPLNISIKS